MPPARTVTTGGWGMPNHEGNIYDPIHVFYEWPNEARATMAQRQIHNCYSDNSDYLLCEKGAGTIKGGTARSAARTKAGDTRAPTNNMHQTEHD